MIKTYKNILCSLVLLTAGAVKADGFKQFDVNDANFKAADKWSDGKAIAVGGAIGAVSGFAVALMTGDQNTLKPCVGWGAAIGGGIEYYLNGRYTKAYDAAHGKTIYGAAAANDPDGVKAWLDYGDSAICQDGDKMTPLMYASANGAPKAVKMVADNMPADYMEVDSVTESESIKRERGGAKTWQDLLNPERITTTSKTKTKKKSADMQSINGRTAAHWAFYGEHFKLMNWLIQRGKANATLTDGEGNNITTMKINGKPAAEALKEMRKRSDFNTIN